MHFRERETTWRNPIYCERELSCTRQPHVLHHKTIILSAGLFSSSFDKYFALECMWCIALYAQHTLFLSSRFRPRSSWERVMIVLEINWRKLFFEKRSRLNIKKKKAENPFQYEYNEIGFIMAVVESIHSLHCTNIFFFAYVDELISRLFVVWKRLNLCMWRKVSHWSTNKGTIETWRIP